MFEDHFQHSLSVAGEPSDVLGWVFLLHIYFIHKQASKMQSETLHSRKLVFNSLTLKQNYITSPPLSSYGEKKTQNQPTKQTNNAFKHS